jgi:hypothetical protein
VTYQSLIASRTEQYKSGNKISLEQVLQARKTLKDFQMFCETFLSNVVGKNCYKSILGKKKIGKIATVGDEAFAILCVENSIERWTDEAEDPTKSDKTNWRPTKYTADPSSSSKYGGWSRDGIRRFNVLSQTIVPELRKSSVNIENLYFQQEYEKRNKTKQPSRLKQTCYDSEDEPYIDPYEEEEIEVLSGEESLGAGEGDEGDPPAQQGHRNMTGDGFAPGVPRVAT